MVVAVCVVLVDMGSLQDLGRATSPLSNPTRSITPMPAAKEAAMTGFERAIDLAIIGLLFLIN